MKKQLWQSLVIAPALLGTAFVGSQNAIADPVNDFNTPAFTPSVQSLPAIPKGQAASEILMRRYQNGTGTTSNSLNQSQNQVTSVSELRDVQPTEWAFEALRSLVERYGCIVGYPDRTFRGNRALTRWEFAAGLNACLNTIERLLQENVAVLTEDIDKIKKLVQQFQSELAALGTRIDNLEQRVSFLEDHNFSTTTKLRSTAIFSISNAFGGDKALSYRDENTRSLQGQDIPENPVMGYRVRLNFDTSFTGKDLLRTRLQAGTIPNYSSTTGTDMSRLGYDTGANAQQVIIDDLFYRFAIGSLTTWIGANGLSLDDVFDVGNPYLNSSDTGALSRYARYNPLVYRGPEGTGLAMRYQFNKMFELRGTYLADQGGAANPAQGNGLFNGSYSAGAQFGFKPLDNLNFAATYLHSYFRAGGVNLTGSTGSNIANNPFFGAPTNRDSYAIQGNWKIFDFLNLSAWGAYALATSQGSASATNAQTGRRFTVQSGAGADLWTWNAALNFLDLGTKGSVFSVGGGLMPRASRVDAFVGEPVAQDQSASYMIETQYQYPLSRNILLTPGVYVILNPNSNTDNDSIWVGVLRTTFRF